MTPDLISLLACPACGAAPLQQTADGHLCAACQTRFPLLDGIPWLFPQPQAALGEWRGRLDRLLKQLDHETRSLDRELGAKDLHALTRLRLKHLRAGYIDHSRRLRELLAPVGLGAVQADHATHLALRTRLPARQGLTSYYANVHRDWVWGGEENEASLQLVAEALNGENSGRLLVLGAGAGRLAYDLHMRCGPALTVALDINPLLMLLARRIAAGRRVELYEFPIAPRDSAAQAVLRTLQADAPARDGLEFVLADGLHAPFAAARFDTVLTPWLIDIIPEDLRAFAPRINALLRQGGRWINFGSLAFVHESHAHCYSLAEVEVLADMAGFSEFAASEAAIRYMCSPASRHARQEEVVTFSARKVRDVTPAAHRALPDWIVEGTQPVPLLQSFQVQAASTRIHAFIMSLIDGRRSLRDMAAVLADQRLMERDEAEAALRSFLIRMYEETLRAPNF